MPVINNSLSFSTTQSQQVGFAVHEQADSVWFVTRPHLLFHLLLPPAI